jgi:hypothetical protein
MIDKKKTFRGRYFQDETKTEIEFLNKIFIKLCRSRCHKDLIIIDVSKQIKQLNPKQYAIYKLIYEKLEELYII